MLSICIPIYNTNCNKLIDDLNAQIIKENIVAEIVCIDDKSTDDFRRHNHILNTKCNYILLEKNIGRARIRNKFLDYVNYEWLLFLDNDSIVSSSTFIKDYISEIKKNKESVICGGTHFVVPNNINNQNNLCFKICEQSEKNVLKNRKKNTYLSFMTNNFAIKKQTLQQIKFDESIATYGHEDTLFGFRLKQNNIGITNIINTVNCIANDSNKQFIIKTKEAVDNLAQITKNLNYNKSFIEDVKLLNAYFKYKKYGLVFFSNILVKPLEVLLVQGFGGVLLFNFYKLLRLTKNNL